MSVGVVIGRFQVDELTEGHRHLIDKVIEQHEAVVILVGESLTEPDEDNPLPVVLRMAMISEEYPDVYICPVRNTWSDATWSQQVDNLLEDLLPGQACTLYGGRDSFLPKYSGVHTTMFVPDEAELVGPSGSMRREHILSSWHWYDGPDFRRGIIYAVTKLSRLGV